MPYSFFHLTAPAPVPVADCHQALTEHLLCMDTPSLEALIQEAEPLYNALFEALTDYQGLHGDLSFLHQAYAADVLCGLIHRLAAEDRSDA